MAWPETTATGSAGRRSSGRLGALAARVLFHAPAARAAVEDVRVVEEAIEERADGRDVAEELAPILDGSIRGEQRADPFVAALDQLEEILGRGGGELAHGEVVDDEERDGGELRHA